MAPIPNHGDVQVWVHGPITVGVCAKAYGAFATKGQPDVCGLFVLSPEAMIDGQVYGPAAVGVLVTTKGLGNVHGLSAARAVARNHVDIHDPCCH